MTFSDAARLEVLADGTFYVRAGVQTNCAGLAGAHVRVTLAARGGITFRPAVGAPGGEGYGPAVPGTDVPAAFRDALFRGARQIYEARAPGLCLCLELIDAMVHPVDANESKFFEAGVMAMEGWLELYGRDSVSRR